MSVNVENTSAILTLSRIHNFSHPKTELSQNEGVCLPNRYGTNKGVSEQFIELDAYHFYRKKCSSYRNPQMSKDFDTKSLRGFFFMVFHKALVLMWDIGGILDHFYHFMSQQWLTFAPNLCTVLQKLMRHN